MNRLKRCRKESFRVIVDYAEPASRTVVVDYAETASRTLVVDYAETASRTVVVDYAETASRTLLEIDEFVDSAITVSAYIVNSFADTDGNF